MNDLHLPYMHQNRHNADRSLDTLDSPMYVQIARAWVVLRTSIVNFTKGNKDGAQLSGSLLYVVAYYCAVCTQKTGGVLLVQNGTKTAVIGAQCVE